MNTGRSTVDFWSGNRGRRPQSQSLFLVWSLLLPWLLLDWIRWCDVNKIPLLMKNYSRLTVLVFWDIFQIKIRDFSDICCNWNLGDSWSFAVVPVELCWDRCQSCRWCLERYPRYQNVFFRVRREFSVIAEGQQIFGRRLKPREKNLSHGAVLSTVPVDL